MYMIECTESLVVDIYALVLCVLHAVYYKIKVYSSLRISLQGI